MAGHFSNRRTPPETPSLRKPGLRKPRIGRWFKNMASGNRCYRNVVAKADRALETLKASGLDLTAWFAGKGALTGADDDDGLKVPTPWPSNCCLHP